MKLKDFKFEIIMIIGGILLISVSLAGLVNEFSKAYEIIPKVMP